MNQKKKIYLSLFFLLFLSLEVGLVSSSVIFGNLSHNIKPLYGEAQNISGWINLSSENSPTNFPFYFSFNNSVPVEFSLIDLLKETPRANYSCSPSNCLDSYSQNSTGSSKINFTLLSGKSKALGFEIFNNIININSVNFNLTSDSGPSEKSQLDIYFLGNKNYTIKNRRGSGLYNPKNYGCFNKSGGTSFVNLDGNSEYCERIALPESPGLNVGVWIKANPGDPSGINMNLEDSKRNSLGFPCTIKQISSSGSEEACTINQAIVSPGNYYICVSSNKGNYQIRKTLGKEVCGLYDTYDETSAYQIFSQGESFGNFGTLEVGNNYLENYPLGGTLGKLSNDYLNKVYKNGNCSNGCFIPIIIKSKIQTSQKVSLSSASIVYSSTSGQVTDNKIYSLKMTPANVSFNFKKIFLDSLGILTPNLNKNYLFSLFSKNKKIFNETIEIKMLPQIYRLFPNSTGYGIQTKFYASVSPNISLYYWNFGDGISDSTSNSTILHEYNSSGIYNLTINITGVGGISNSKTFKINVTSPINEINSLIQKKEGFLNQIKQSIDSFEIPIKELIINYTGLKNLSLNLKTIKLKTDLAKSKKDYQIILDNLSNLKIPQAILLEKEGSNLEIFPQKDNIDLSTLTSITKETYNDTETENYKTAIFNWEFKHSKILENFKEVETYKGDGSKQTLRIINLEININNPKGAYLIIKTNNLFSKNSFKKIGDSSYIPLNSGENSLTFLVPGDSLSSSTDLPLFISPALGNLTIISGKVDLGNKKIKPIILFFVLFGIFLVGLSIYFGLREWYKIKYEKYLFKNRNNLYNLVLYINNLKKQGKKDWEIKGSLKKAGWSSEQITYVLRKYAGKRTGMI